MMFKNEWTWSAILLSCIAFSFGIFVFYLYAIFDAACQIPLVLHIFQYYLVMLSILSIVVAWIAHKKENENERTHLILILSVIMAVLVLTIIYLIAPGSCGELIQFLLL